LVVEGDGTVVAVFEALEVVLAGVLGGVDTGGEAAVEGAADVVCSDELGAGSFFSPVAGTGASLPGDGFILSE
jgi:ribonuclease HIII